MNDWASIHQALARLDAMLDQERACMIEFRFGDLLKVVRAKQVAQSALAQELSVVQQAGRPAHGLGDLQREIRQVQSKARQNNLLARASWKVVTGLLGFLGGSQLASRQYDRQGRAAPAEMAAGACGATLSSSA
jgi:hypothetical protein